MFKIKKTNQYENHLKRAWQDRKYKLAVFGFSSHFDWIVILFISIIIFLTISFFTWNFWKKATAQADIVSSDVDIEDNVDVSKLKRVLQDFENKKNSTYPNGVPTVQTSTSTPESI